MGSAGCCLGTMQEFLLQGRKDEIAALKLDINQFMAELEASNLELEKLQMENAELVATHFFSSLT